MVFAFGFQNLLFINSAEEEGGPNVFTFVGLSVSLSVCLSVCLPVNKVTQKVVNRLS